MGEFHIKKLANGQYHWTLTAPNGEVIATSETYLTKAGAENGIRSVKLYAGTAQVHDATVASGVSRWF